ncbi:MAG: UDP-3-O-(3-hydroxymyristoyl)glucosamine N-acyltransferase [Saprospiraceae bacterium]
MSAKDLADFLNARIEGDPNVEVSHPSNIEEAQAGSVSFFGNPKYEPFVYSTNASILVVGEDFVPQQKVNATLLRVGNVYQSLSTLLSHFEENGKPSGISSLATIDKSTLLGEDVAVSSYVVIEQNSKIGAGSIIYAQVFIGHDVEIGKNCIIYPGVKIYSGCKIGDEVIMHANTVIGGEGFGFVMENGAFKKIPQLGNVILEDNVEIGSNCSIDRATMGSTIIRKGCKLDNLIQIGHNVEIGENTVIAAQAGIAGSAKIGARCMIGGQVGIAGHIHIPDGTQIQAQSGVMSVSDEQNQRLFGYPAFEYRDYLKSYAVFKNLPELESRLRELEKKNISPE